MLCLVFAGGTTHLALVRLFFLQHSLEVVKKLFVKLDWTIGYFGLPFHLTYFKTVLEFLRKLITN